MRGRCIHSIPAHSTDAWHSAAASAPEGSRVAPLRFQIWQPGINRGDWGITNVTPTAAERVLAAFERRGVLLGINVEHNTNPKANPGYDPSNPPRGGGYFGLKLVKTSTGLAVWADPVRWSDYAQAQIEGGERCYFSPEWEQDPATHEPIEIRRISLVMEPATHGIPLLASRPRWTHGRVSLLPPVRGLQRLRIS